MNHIYKVVWNKGKKCYSVVSEMAKNHGKSSSCRKKAMTALMVVSLLSVGGISSAEEVHYFSVGANDGGAPADTNWNNDGAKGIISMAIGPRAEASDAYSLAAGAYAKAKGGQSASFGTNAVADGESATAIGAATIARGKGAIAFGGVAKALGGQSSAIGSFATAEGSHSSAVGTLAKAQASGSTAIGVQSTAKQIGSVALGADSLADRDAGVRGVDVSTGKEISEDALLGDKKEEYQKEVEKLEKLYAEEDSLQKDLKASLDNDPVDNDGNKIESDNTKNLRQNLAEKRKETDAQIQVVNGYVKAWQSTEAAVSVGNAEANITRQITGVAAGTEDTDVVNVAQLKAAVKDVNTEAAKHTTVVAGTNITVDEGTNDNGGKAYTVKLNDTLTGLKGVETEKITISDKVTIDKDGLKTGDVTIKEDGIHAGNKVITGVAAGKDDTDAVNVAQLKSVQTEAAKHTTVVAGKNVTVDEGTNDKGGKEYTVKLNDTLTGLKSVETEKITVGDKVTIDKDGLKTGDVTIKEEGIHAGNKVITGVADGVNPTDAVNMRQFGVLENKVETNTRNISLLNGRVDVLDTRVDRVGAGAAALAGLHPLDYDPENKWDFAAGYGNYKGANAIAVGAFYRPDENKMISIGGSFGGGENMVSAGFSVKLGQGTGISTSKAAMANEIRELKARDREREAQMQEIMRQLEILRRQAGK